MKTPPATASRDDDGPSGRPPRRLTRGSVISHAWIILWLAFFLMPLYLMVSTSLKPMDEIRLGTMFRLPSSPSFTPWIDAWFNACTGASCRGLKSGFFNSLKLMFPSVAAMMLAGIVNGYALAFWRPIGRRSMLNLLYVTAFVPYQVIVYPLVQILSAIQLANSITGAAVVHLIYHLPVMSLFFYNYFMTIPTEMSNAARVDGAGFCRFLISIILPMSLPAVAVGGILAVTIVWNDYQIASTFAGRENLPMTVQLAHLVESESGSKFYNIQMAATLLTSLVPLVVYVVSGRWYAQGLMDWRN